MQKQIFLTFSKKIIVSNPHAVHMHTHGESYRVLQFRPRQPFSTQTHYYCTFCNLFGFFVSVLPGVLALLFDKVAGKYQLLHSLFYQAGTRTRSFFANGPQKFRDFFRKFCEVCWKFGR